MYISLSSQKIRKQNLRSVAVCVLFCFFVITVSALFCACDNDKIYQITLLGSPVSFYVSDANYVKNSETDKKITQSLYDLSERLNAVFSTEDKSQMSAYNTVIGQKEIKIDNDFYQMTLLYKKLYEEFDGAVNPQVKLLVDLWGFSKRYKQPDYFKTASFDRIRNSDGSFPLPDQKYVEAFKTLSDFSLTKVYEKQNANDIHKTELFIQKSALSVTVDNETFYSMLDYSSVVKGYFCDEAKKIFDDFGIKNYYLSAGGSSMYLAENNNDVWNLQIVDPFSQTREGYLTIPVSGKFVSTSGTYENCYETDGVFYSHIIDPKTGCPTKSKTVSATVIGDNGAYTDAVSTACIILGDKAESYLSGKGYDYVLIMDDGTVVSNVYDKITFLKSYKE